MAARVMPVLCALLLAAAVAGAQDSRSASAQPTVNINTATSEQVTPLPFHGMRSYPGPADQQAPRTEEIRRYLKPE